MRWEATAQLDGVSSHVYKLTMESPGPERGLRLSELCLHSELAAETLAQSTLFSQHEGDLSELPPQTLRRLGAVKAFQW